jgi:hypothetical protein
LLQDECLHPTEFFLEPVSEVVRAVFEENDKAKSEEDKQSDPKYPTQQ